VALSFKEHFILLSLKNYIINELHLHDKDNQEKAQLKVQLQFEKDFQTVIDKIKSLTEQMEEIWSEVSLQNFSIKSIFLQFQHVIEEFISVKEKFMKTSQNHQNLEMLMIFASFTDLVMNYELEAQELYMKAQQLSSNIYVARSKQEENGNNNSQIQ